MENLKIDHTPEKFRDRVELFVREGGMTYLEAVMEYCEMEGLEPEVMPKLLKKNVKILGEIQLEAENKNLVEKTSRLPI